MTTNELSYDLTNGVQLSVSNVSGMMTIREVADGLAKALIHFKHRRDGLGEVDYTGGPFFYRASRKRRTIGTMTISATEGSLLTTDCWVKVVVRTLAEAVSLEQTLGQRRAWRAEARKRGGWILEVMNLLARRGGDFDALRLVLSRAPHVV